MAGTIKKKKKLSLIIIATVVVFPPSSTYQYGEQRRFDEHQWRAGRIDATWPYLKRSDAYKI